MPTTEFIRSEGMGGGVGGMVYSIKDDGNGGDSIISSHANHRGDVIARSNESRSLISFALYEAYGTRPYEWGDDPDRQKANTKEEETDLGLLNEGFRFRDLETGTFLTADPLEFADGPNRYCYVHCNPITHFDAFGLEESPTTGGDEMDDEDDPLEDSVDAYDAALMAEDSYKDKDHKAPDVYEHLEDFTDENIGFSASLYRNKNTKELVLAFRGTDEKVDWKESGKNGWNASSAQYKMAIDVTKSVIGNKDYANGDKSRLTLVGHSLGGGLASTAAVQLGIDAITFNAAGMHPSYAESSDYNVNDYVDAYYVKGEILSHVQDRNPLFPAAAGNRIGLRGTHGGGLNTIIPGMGIATGKQRYDAHLMPAVKNALRNEGYAENHDRREYERRMDNWGR